MSIRVTCTGCHTRFNVSEQFAGKDGPCPKCKKTIKIPSASEEVQVHAPENFGPKTGGDKAVFKPIKRKEASLSPVQMVLIGATIFGFLAIAFMMRTSIADKDSFPSWVLLVASMVLAVPCVYAGYTFLRDSELGAFDGNDLWIRVGACSVAYGIAWLVNPIVSYVVGPEVGTFISVGLMFVIGAVTAYLFLGIDFFVGILHYGLFFGCCLLLRTVAGFDALPIPESAASDIDDLLNADNGPSAMLDAMLEFCQLLV